MQNTKIYFTRSPKNISSKNILKERKYQEIHSAKPISIAQRDFRDIREFELELQNNVRNKAGYLIYEICNGLPRCSHIKFCNVFRLKALRCQRAPFKTIAR